MKLYYTATYFSIDYPLELLRFLQLAATAHLFLNNIQALKNPLFFNACIAINDFAFFSLPIVTATNLKCRPWNGSPVPEQSVQPA